MLEGADWIGSLAAPAAAAVVCAYVTVRIHLDRQRQQIARITRGLGVRSEELGIVILVLADVSRRCDLPPSEIRRLLELLARRLDVPSEPLT